MKYRILTTGDAFSYRDDIFKCYESCKLIFDSQNILKPKCPEDAIDFLANFIVSKDSMVLGILDDSEEFLYGLVIFDNMRFADYNCAQCHIINDRAIWGKKIKGIYEKILNESIFDVIYCEIPSIAVHPIAMCKRLGFKKTGYIPKALPYKNTKEEEKMYDIQIYTFQRKEAKDA